jgi:hypothetical protein
MVGKQRQFSETKDNVLADLEHASRMCGINRVAYILRPASSSQFPQHVSSVLHNDVRAACQETPVVHKKLWSRHEKIVPARQQIPNVRQSRAIVRSGRRTGKTSLRLWLTSQIRSCYKPLSGYRTKTMTLSESHVYAVLQIGTTSGSRICEGDTGPENRAAGLCAIIPF